MRVLRALELLGVGRAWLASFATSSLISLISRCGSTPGFAVATIWNVAAELLARERRRTSCAIFSSYTSRL